MFDVHHKPYGLTSLPSECFYQVHKVNIQQKCIGEFYKVWTIQVLVQLVAHRTLFDAQAEAPRELAALGFSQSHSTKIHQTVWCVTGLSGEPIAEHKSEVSLQSQNAPDCLVCHRTVRCRKKTEDFNDQQLQTPTVGWHGTHRTVNSAVSGAPPNCPVCLSTSKSANG